MNLFAIVGFEFPLNYFSFKDCDRVFCLILPNGHGCGQLGWPNWLGCDLGQDWAKKYFPRVYFRGCSYFCLPTILH